MASQSGESKDIETYLYCSMLPLIASSVSKLWKLSFVTAQKTLCSHWTDQQRRHSTKEQGSSTPTSCASRRRMRPCWEGSSTLLRLRGQALLMTPSRLLRIHPECPAVFTQLATQPGSGKHSKERNLRKLFVKVVKWISRKAPKKSSGQFNW